MRPVVFPAWLAACVALASGVVIVFLGMATIALWQVALVKAAPLTPEERDALRENFPTGTFINDGTYRVCLQGQEWFFYTNGDQSSYGHGCWK